MLTVFASRWSVETTPYSRNKKAEFILYNNKICLSVKKIAINMIDKYT